MVVNTIRIRNANMSTYMFTSTSTSTSTSNMSTFSYFENAGDALSRMQSSLHLYPLRAHFLSLSPSILWLRVFSPGGRSTSPLTCRATHVCRVRLQSYAPTVALRHSCLFLSLREPLSPSLLVHSATRRPTAAHQPSPPLSTTVLAEPQISPSLRSRRASDLAEQLALALQEGVELRFRLLGAHENVGDHLVRDSLLSRLRR